MAPVNMEGGGEIPSGSRIDSGRRVLVLVQADTREEPLGAYYWDVSNY